MSINPVVGVDFDNTLVTYDNILFNQALEKGFIKQGTAKNKRYIRNEVRQLPDGEIKWRELQAEIYGNKMEEAILIDGVKGFFSLCKSNMIKVYVVSHKTEFPNTGKSKIDLRRTALKWMKKEGFFESSNGWGIAPNEVYFESTRSEKIARVKHLKCTHFIDDLEETFAETSFPINVEKILYNPHAHHLSLPGVRTASTWKEISDYFFATKS